MKTIIMFSHISYVEPTLTYSTSCHACIISTQSILQHQCLKYSWGRQLNTDEMDLLYSCSWCS